MLDIKGGLSFVASTLTAEHMISAGMSSPWSVAKFAQSDQDKQQVWTLFTEAILVSLGISIVTGILLGGGSALWWAVIGTAAVGLYVGSEYQRALNGTL